MPVDNAAEAIGIMGTPSLRLALSGSEQATERLWCACRELELLAGPLRGGAEQSLGPRPRGTDRGEGHCARTVTRCTLHAPAGELLARCWGTHAGVAGPFVSGA